MTYVAPIYKPTESVKTANNIPRFDYTSFSQIEANDFPGEFDLSMPPSDPYIKGLATLPIILMVLGFVSIVLMQLILFLRCCCRCFTCAPHEDDIATNPVKVIKSRNRVFYGFWLFIVIMLISDHLLYFGDADLNSGKDNLVLSLQLLKDVFNDIKTATSTLVSENTDLTDITQQIAAGACNNGNPYGAGTEAVAVNTMNAAAESMLTAFTAIDDLVKNLPDQIQTFIDSVEKFGGEYKNIGMYMLYGLMLILNLLFMAGACLTSKKIMYFAYLSAEVVCLFSTIICGVVMIIVQIYGDFCMNPSQNMMDFMGPGSGYDLLEYFSACQGTDPFASNVQNSQNGLNTFSNTISDNFATVCATNNNPSATDAATAITGMNSGIAGISAATTCASLNPVYDTFMNQAMCTNMFDGLWKIWLCGCICSVSLFFLMAFGSVLWAYFGVAWKLRPEDDHTGAQVHLSGTNMEPAAVANYAAPTGYKEEYTFTAASPSAPALTRKEIEMI